MQTPHQINRTRLPLPLPPGKEIRLRKESFKTNGQRKKNVEKNRNLTKSDSLRRIVLNLLAVPIQFKPLILLARVL